MIRWIREPSVAALWTVTAVGAACGDVKNDAGADDGIGVPTSSAEGEGTAGEVSAASADDDDGDDAADTSPAEAGGTTGDENDTPPPPGSEAEQFEDFCAENPGAC